MLKYKVERDEKIIGEYSTEQIMELTSSGELLGTDIIYAEDSTDQQTIVEFSVSQEIASELSKDRGGEGCWKVARQFCSSPEEDGG